MRRVDAFEYLGADLALRRVARAAGSERQPGIVAIDTRIDLEVTEADRTLRAGSRKPEMPGDVSAQPRLACPQLAPRGAPVCVRVSPDRELDVAHRDLDRAIERAAANIHVE